MEIFEKLRNKIEGKQISHRQLAGNSLSLWIDHVPDEDDDRGWVIWLDPTWNIVDSDRVLAGSRQAQDETEESGWKAVTKTIGGLIGLTVERLEAESITCDLIILLSSGVTVRTFASDPRETQNWWIRDRATEESVKGSPSGVEAVEKREDA